jgi:hypothetical protein
VTHKQQLSDDNVDGEQTSTPKQTNTKLNAHHVARKYHTLHLPKSMTEEQKAR